MIVAGAIPFDRRTVGPVTEGFIERVRPGAFRSSIEMAEPIACINHVHDKPLASMAAGDLRIVERDRSLIVEMDLDLGRDAHYELARAAVRGGVGLSFRMRHVEYVNVGSERHVQRARLMHIAFLIGMQSAYPSRVRIWP
jgi:phage head maturation protease